MTIIGTGAYCVAVIEAIALVTLAVSTAINI